MADKLINKQLVDIIIAELSRKTVLARLYSFQKKLLFSL